MIFAALESGKHVVTSNKAAAAALRKADPHLFYSAAVGGALPALEILASLKAPVREIRGIINGTCGAVLDACGECKSLEEAVALAKSAANPRGLKLIARATRTPERNRRLGGPG